MRESHGKGTRRNLPPRASQPKWSSKWRSSELTRLARLHAEHGNSWATLAELLRRSRTDVKNIFSSSARGKASVADRSNWGRCLLRAYAGSVFYLDSSDRAGREAALRVAQAAADSTVSAAGPDGPGPGPDSADEELGPDGGAEYGERYGRRGEDYGSRQYEYGEGEGDDERGEELEPLEPPRKRQAQAPRSEAHQPQPHLLPRFPYSEAAAGAGSAPAAPRQGPRPSASRVEALAAAAVAAAAARSNSTGPWPCGSGTSASASLNSPAASLPSPPQPQPQRRLQHPYQQQQQHLHQMGLDAAADPGLTADVAVLAQALGLAAAQSGPVGSMGITDVLRALLARRGAGLGGSSAPQQQQQQQEAAAAAAEAAAGRSRAAAAAAEPGPMPLPIQMLIRLGLVPDLDPGLGPELGLGSMGTGLPQGPESRTPPLGRRGPSQPAPGPEPTGLDLLAAMLGPGTGPGRAQRSDPDSGRGLARGPGQSRDPVERGERIGGRGYAHGPLASNPEPGPGAAAGPRGSPRAQGAAWGPAGPVSPGSSPGLRVAKDERCEDYRRLGPDYGAGPSPGPEYGYGRGPEAEYGPDAVPHSADAAAATAEYGGPRGPRSGPQPPAGSTGGRLAAVPAAALPAALRASLLAAAANRAAAGLSVRSVAYELGGGY
ncbi:hypothetical protein HYH03_013571 [Edaphochlamys debaryana]|uniref:Myb-like domain-containing protein n=1 Tax=Edaphochlamys debaryana TaxID=47281 RepID=A0A836BUF6_9CHLO|nr:hypothetical protein HYH03_013571 [Edaphochlamys debaryana]|eukprot:KAG2487854.1 hypothetical protein HYH03_013571 [Edaphochlamys debaryana]